MVDGESGRGMIVETMDDKAETQGGSSLQVDSVLLSAKAVVEKSAGGARKKCSEEEALARKEEEKELDLIPSIFLLALRFMAEHVVRSDGIAMQWVIGSRGCSRDTEEPGGGHAILRPM